MYYTWNAYFSNVVASPECFVSEVGHNRLNAWWMWRVFLCEFCISTERQEFGGAEAQFPWETGMLLPSRSRFNTLVNRLGYTTLISANAITLPSCLGYSSERGAKHSVPGAHRIWRTSPRQHISPGRARIIRERASSLVPSSREVVSHRARSAKSNWIFMKVRLILQNSLR